MSYNVINKMSSPMTYRKKYPAPQRPSIQELKLKYECPPPNTITNTIATVKMTKSFKMSNKSKVKQMASMFNSKISQIIGRDNEIKKNAGLANELSAQQPKATTLPKPLPLPRLARQTKEKAPVPSPRAKSKAKLQQKASCFVAEDVFAKLTVKDKAMLYTQFIGDMAKKNPKFGKHAELMEANVKKRIARGEVVNEKQESVKRLLEDLEARCAFPKQTISPIGEQRMNSVRSTNRRSCPSAATIKSKEFEDIVVKPRSHISTLTVTLQQSPEIKRQRRARSLPRRKSAEDPAFKDLAVMEPSHKRNNDEMRSTLPIEAYAPPKKIRRSRAEHLAPKTFFQNQQLEMLFYSWLKERHGQEVNQSEDVQISELSAAKEKSVIDKLLEEAIVKLENVETTQKKTEEIPVKKENPIKDTEVFVQSKEVTAAEIFTMDKPKQLVTKLEVIPVVTSESSTTSSIVSSTKHSEAEESESGLSYLAKLTSDDSQPESLIDKPEAAAALEFQFVKPLAPLRKKKLRRSWAVKKEPTVIDTQLVSTTTDSESDGKESKPICKKTSTKTQHLNVNLPSPGCPRDPSFEALNQSLDRVVNALTKPQALSMTGLPDEPSFGDLDKSLMRVVNSPNKIKSAYTLTVFSPPPPYNEEESKTKPQLAEMDSSYVGKSASPTLTEDKRHAEPNPLADSFDQGFETGSNDVDSPVRPPRKSSLKRQEKTYAPLFIKLGTAESRRVSIDPSTKTENPACFSTPIKGETQQTFDIVNRNGAQQQLFSPIAKPYKNRRRSIYESESRRNSVAMQVIREDQPLENHEIQSPNTVNNTTVFFANAPTLDMTDMTGLNTRKTSSYWIKAGEFSISLEVFHNDADRVKLLYEIFSQRSCDTKDLHFGIDDHKFSVHNAEEYENVSKRLPINQENSHYWFSTGDLAIPFSGKLLSSAKIQRLFGFIKEAVEESGKLRFGIDNVEFSNVPEMWVSDSPKYSMESTYSMLVGLQSGNSNGLEGRSKYAWPHSKPVPVSDLDNSEFECDDFEESESGRMSFSPFGSNQFDFTSTGNEHIVSTLNKQTIMKSPESFYMQFENEPLDQLFDDLYMLPQQQKNDLTNIPAVPEMLNTLQQQQQRLSSVQDRLSGYGNPSNLSSDALDALKGTPEYLTQLKGIIADIAKLGCRQGFKDCSAEQLERYLFFMSRYADIWLNSCSDQMDQILDALMESKSTEV